jgi:solute carrier family 9B (sodium/hydrogen exchanger), member 1/2
MEIEKLLFSLKQCLIISLAWTVLWLATDDNTGHGVLLAIFVLFSSSVLFGFIAELVKLPSLVGMLVIGFVIRNASEAQTNLFVVDTTWSSTIRYFALILILLRAGLGINMNNIRRMSVSVMTLAFVPNVVEATVDASLAVVLFNMPWVYAYMLGFIISAVSPAVVVPSLLKLKEQKYGTEKGIPDLVLAAASFDDVLSISGFGICLGLAYGGEGNGDGELIFNIFRAPLELFLGICGGVLFGKLSTYISPNPNNNHITKLLLLIGFSGLTIFGGKRLEFTGAGALATIVLGIVAKHEWIRSCDNSDKKLVLVTSPTNVNTDINDTINNIEVLELYLKDLWNNCGQPLLFVLIGASVSTTFLDGRFVARGLLLLFTGLCVRVSVSMACLRDDHFTIHERIFVSISWLPKATVQAALGAVALDKAYQLNSGENDEKIDLGRQILTIAVLSIVVTAPMGAILIAYFGPKLLVKEVIKDEIDMKQQHQKQEQEQDKGSCDVIGFC